MCKVYTDVRGIRLLYHVCPPVRKIIHSLKLVDYLHIKADNPWYNYYVLFDCIELENDLDDYEQNQLDMFKIYSLSLEPYWFQSVSALSNCTFTIK